MASSKNIEHKAIDASGCLGSLYDDRRHCILKERHETVRGRSLRSSQSPYCKITNGNTDTGFNLLETIGIDDELRLNLLLKLTNRVGVASAMNYSRRIDEWTRVLYYSYIDRKEQVNDMADVSKMLESSDHQRSATHVITAIDFGIDLVVILQLPPTADIAVDIDHILEKIRMILLRNDSTASMLTREEDRLLEKNTNITVYSNTSKFMSLNTISDILLYIDRMKKEFNSCHPITYYLFPTTQLHPQYYAQVRPISSTLIKEIEQYLLQLRLPIRYLEASFKHHTPLSFYGDILDQVCKSQQQWSRLKDKYVKTVEQFSDIITSIRSGRSDASAARSALCDNGLATLKTNINQLAQVVCDLLEPKQLITQSRQQPINHHNPVEQYSYKTSSTRTTDVTLERDDRHDKSFQANQVWNNNNDFKRNDFNQVLVDEDRNYSNLFPQSVHSHYPAVSLPSKMLPLDNIAYNENQSRPSTPSPADVPETHELPPQTPAVPELPPQTPAVPELPPQTPAVPELPPQTPAVPELPPQTPAVPELPPQTPAVPELPPQTPAVPELPPQTPAVPELPPQTPAVPELPPQTPAVPELPPQTPAVPELPPQTPAVPELPPQTPAVPELPPQTPAVPELPPQTPAVPELPPQTPAVPELPLPTTDPIINILLLGETGVGKSTFINAFVNYLSFDTFEQAELNKPVVLIPVSFLMTVGDNFEERIVKFGAVDDSKNEDFDHPGQSVTQHCKSYIFHLNDGKKLCIIDTPGFGDTRGLDQDDRNMQNILEYINNLDHLNAICFLLKPNTSRLNIFFRSCLTQILDLLGPNICKNLTFCFTNARATFYTPGDTAPLLKRMLESLSIKDISFEKENTFCFDNESFRYLVALRDGIPFTKEDQQEYEKSWSNAVKESNRLIDYIRKKIVLYLKQGGWQSNKHAQFEITYMIRPILETMRNILRNIILQNAGARNKSIELHPTVVHRSASLCLSCKQEKIQIDNFLIIQDCPHEFQNTCLLCPCLPEQHIRIDYILDYKSMNTSSDHLKNNTNDVLNQLCEASAKFAYFLVSIASSTNEDPFESGLTRMITQENDLCHDQNSSDLNSQLAKDLIKLQDKYVQNINRLKSNPEHASLPQIYDLINNIGKLPMVETQMNAVRRGREIIMKQHENEHQEI